MSEQSQPDEVSTLTIHEARRRSLERRLADGYDRIDQAALLGNDVADWESFWISLLREYEDVCRDLEVAA